MLARPDNLRTQRESRPHQLFKKEKGIDQVVWSSPHIR